MSRQVSFAFGGLRPHRDSSGAMLFLLKLSNIINELCKESKTKIQITLAPHMWLLIFNLISCKVLIWTYERKCGVFYTIRWQTGFSKLIGNSFQAPYLWQANINQGVTPQACNMLFNINTCTSRPLEYVKPTLNPYNIANKLYTSGEKARLTQTEPVPLNTYAFEAWGLLLLISGYSFVYYLTPQVINLHRNQCKERIHIHTPIAM